MYRTFVFRNLCCLSFVQHRKTMTASGPARVFLCRDKNGQSIPAEFEKCCLTCLGCRTDRTNIGFSYKDGKLEIYPSEQGIRLEHPPSCPCRFLTAGDIAGIPSSPKTQGVSVGVAVLLQSADDYVLLTRRAKHMRTFPGVWVPPGGHIEAGESLNTAVLRELREETGLCFLENGLAKITPLGLWESVYPPKLSMGLPKRHHIVLYLLAHATEGRCSLERRVKFAEEEVDAITWLDQDTVANIATSDDYGQAKNVQQMYFSALVKDHNGCPTKEDLPLSILMSVLPPTNKDVERLSTGTKFALRQWLKFLYPPSPGALVKGDSLESVFVTITKEGHQALKSSFLQE